MINYCKGCGVALQTSNPKEIGYVLPTHLHTQRCQRCFKINQYSEFQKVDINNEKLFEMIQHYNPQKDVITLVVDLSDLVETCLFELADMLKMHKTIVVVNKIDIILSDMRHYEIWEDYLQNLFDKHGIEVAAFFFVSAKEQLGIKRLIRYFYQLPLHQIRIIGCANVGKSSLIQALFHDSDVPETIMPTIFMTPGTTLEELEIQWGAYKIYDTPGIMKPQQLTYYVKNKDLKEILINKAIKPKNYHIYEPQTFFIAGYAQINVYPKDTNTITFFCANNLPIHRKKITNDDAFFQQHIGELLSPPSLINYRENEQIQKRQLHTMEIKRNKQDVVISGLGWISLNKKEVNLEIITVDGVKVYQQHAIV